MKETPQNNQPNSLTETVVETSVDVILETALNTTIESVTVAGEFVVEQIFSGL